MTLAETSGADYRGDDTPASGRDCMSARVDAEIARLVSAARAAERLGCSRAWVVELVHRGRLVGTVVGRSMVLDGDQVEALVALRAAGADTWCAPGPAPTIPPLLSTGQAAQRLGFAQGNWPRRLHTDGKLPGVVVGDDLVFRTAVVDLFAAARQLGQDSYPGADDPTTAPVSSE